MKARAMAAVLAVSALVAAGPAAATKWVAVGMLRIPIRAYAAAAAPVVASIAGGSYLALTGRCTGGLDMAQISYMSPLRQRLIVTTRWCEVSDPTHGWVFGGFMKPF